MTTRTKTDNDGDTDNFDAYYRGQAPCPAHMESIFPNRGEPCKPPSRYRMFPAEVARSRVLSYIRECPWWFLPDRTEAQLRRQFESVVKTIFHKSLPYDVSEVINRVGYLKMPGGLIRRGEQRVQIDESTAGRP